MATVEEMLKTAESLVPPDIDRFVDGVLALRARRKNSLSSREAELLVRINQPFPTELRDEYDLLIEKRKAETLSEDEYLRLSDLSDQMEQLGVEWLQNLDRLAAIRQVDLDSLMDEMGLYIQYA